jgi:hypothetical protein
MFNQKVLYPEYEPNMLLYKKEAALLANYMREHYQIDYSYAKNGLLEIPLEERWLKGEEYAFLLRHYKTYSQLGGFQVNDRCQELLVYEAPRSKCPRLLNYF